MNCLSPAVQPIKYIDNAEHIVVTMQITKKRAIPSDIFKYIKNGIIAAKNVTMTTFKQTLTK